MHKEFHLHGNSERSINIKQAQDSSLRGHRVRNGKRVTWRSSDDLFYLLVCLTDVFFLHVSDIIFISIIVAAGNFCRCLPQKNHGV